MLCQNFGRVSCRLAAMYMDTPNLKRLVACYWAGGRPVPLHLLSTLKHPSANILSATYGSSPARSLEIALLAAALVRTLVSTTVCSAG
jgi:hypothetical protein